MIEIDARHPPLRSQEPSRRKVLVAGLASGLALAVEPALTEAQTGAGPEMEIKVSPKREVVTLINVFSVEPGSQENLMQVLNEGTEQLFSRQRGYVSTSFHKSHDGRRIVKAMAKRQGHRSLSG